VATAAKKYDDMNIDWTKVHAGDELVAQDIRGDGCMLIRLVRKDEGRTSIAVVDSEHKAKELALIGYRPLSEEELKNETLMQQGGIAISNSFSEQGSS